LIGSIDRPSVARAKGQTAMTKTAGRNLPISLPISFRKETRGERDGFQQSAEARFGHEATAAFFVEPNVILPGHGTTRLKGNLVFFEPAENTPFSERKRFFSSTEFEMIDKRKRAEDLFSALSFQKNIFLKVNGTRSVQIYRLMENGSSFFLKQRSIS
jgi:hypothetical protein